MNKIPKIIHYCWFSGDSYSNTAIMVLNSWQTLLPEYEFRKWTSSDIDIYENKFITKAYQHKKWAYVSDYIRLKALYQYGGIYMDLDFLLIKDLNPLLKYNCFFGRQSEELIDCAIIGAEARHPFIHQLMLHYQKKEFNPQSPSPMPSIVTPQLKELGSWDKINSIFSLGNITIFPPEYFYAYPFPVPRNKTYLDFLTEHSIGVHLWEGSWLTAKNYFNIGDCKKGLIKLESEGKSNFISRSYWRVYCSLKNLIRPLYRKIKG